MGNKDVINKSTDIDVTDGDTLCEYFGISRGDRFGAMGELFTIDSEGTVWHACVPGRRWENSEAKYYLEQAVNRPQLLFSRIE